MEFIPYLYFNGQCQEALKFYEKVFNGKIAMMMTYGQSPAAQHVPAEMRDQVIHARLDIGSYILLASDAPHDKFAPPQGFSISISVKDVAEADRVFNALVEKGSVQMPIGPTFWSVRFGMLTDRFGVPWMVNCVQAPPA